MTSTTARRLGADARREQLVAIGLDLAATVPIDQISPDVIASRAGVSKGLVFHYFPAKRDLHLAILRAGQAELLARLDFDPAMEPEERLHRGLEGFVSYIEEHPVAYASVARGAAADEHLIVVFEETRTAIIEMISATVGVDELPAGMRIALRGWIALVEEAVLVWLDDKPIPRRQLVRFLEMTAASILTDAVALGTLED